MLPDDLAIDDVRRYRTTPDLIAGTLRQAICDGRLRPGDALRQDDLAARFAVSRMPAREALQRLEAEGLVVVYPHRGAFVAQLSHDEIAEIYDLRLLLEPDLLARAIPHYDAEAAQRIRHAAERSEAAGSGPEGRERDWDFHRALYAPAGRARQLQTIESLRATSDRYWIAYARLPENTAAWLGEHGDIAGAALAGDVERAVSRLRDHLGAARAFVLRQLPTPKEPR